MKICRGFAAMNPERRKEIASQGGKAAQASGKAHQLTPDDARRGGMKGGGVLATRPGHMSELGRKSARASGHLPIAEDITRRAS